MGVKGSWSRGKYSSYCTRDCANRDTELCNICYKFDNFEPNEKGDTNVDSK